MQKYGGICWVFLLLVFDSFVQSHRFLVPTLCTNCIIIWHGSFSPGKSHRKSLGKASCSEKIPAWRLVIRFKMCRKPLYENRKKRSPTRRQRQFSKIPRGDGKLHAGVKGGCHVGFLFMTWSPIARKITWKARTYHLIIYLSITIQNITKFHKKQLADCSHYTFVQHLLINCTVDSWSRW